MFNASSSYGARRVLLAAAATVAGVAGVATVALAPAVPAAAAVILDQAVTVAVRADGSVAEHTRLAVRLYTARDLAAWSPYPIDLDENRKLASLNTYVTEPGGRVVQVVRRGEPQKLRALEIPVVLPGSVFTLDYEVEEKPHFPSGSIRLGGTGDRIEQLRVEVKGEAAALPGWRWRLDGPRDGLHVEESPGRVVITASGLPAIRPPENSPESLGPVLRYSWGAVSTWQGIGHWYQGLLAAMPHGTPAVRQKAQEIAGRIAGRRQKIEALAAFVRRDVRYVTFKVGIDGTVGGSGYRPAPPADVLARRSGDCKDKSVLLVDLLAAAGVEAYPALIRLSPQGRVDADFPAPNEFNHLVVAVSAAGLEPKADDPVAGGFLFIDPTETLGSAFWLPAYDQDQDALVVRGDQSLLVHTALRPAAESQLLEVDLATTPAGDGVGHVYLELTGQSGATWVNRLAARKREENEADARALLGVALPGATLTDLGISASGRGVPSLRLSARAEIPRLLSGNGSSLRFQAATLYGMPPPGPLERRQLPVVLTPAVTRSIWRVQLPAGTCPPIPEDATVNNDLGSFRQRVALERGLLTLERRAELKSRWIGPERFPALRELALAEYRTGRRGLRLECAAAGR
ncbi:MAG TPA: hypothetical protein VGR07_17910 [Thermoanaerobaculia bacterium]|jgi:hypothetical protein|nr:hypothetical protein [Thermoanaerobaculia bacterium]